MMKMLKHIKNSSGFSLLELMMTIAISTLVIVGFMNFMKIQLSSAKYVESVGTIDSLTNSVRFYFLDRDACGQILGGSTLPSTPTTGMPITQIKDRNGTVVHTIPKPPSNGEVATLQSAELFNSASIGPSGYGVATVRLTFTRNTNVSAGSGTVYKDLPVVIETGTSSEIVKCVSSADNAVESAYNMVCEDMGGKVDVETKKCTFFPLLKGQHTEHQCTDAGATLVVLPEGSICKFPAAVEVPDSWTSHEDWTTTVSTVPKDSDCTVTNTNLNAANYQLIMNNPDQYAAYPAQVETSCTTGSHAWGNIPLETCAFTCVEKSPCAGATCRHKNAILTNKPTERGYY